MSVPRYVIIGNGVAGMTAAQEIRRADPDGVLTLIGDEAERYYYRASLSEWLAGDNADEAVYGRTPAFYADLQIKKVNGLVTHVHPERQTLTLQNGDTLPYDQLLIATGAKARIVPIKGLNHPNVYRTWQDAREIKAQLTREGELHQGRALILGGGILGLELAGALVKMGIQKIALVQRSAFVGKPILDQHAAKWLQRRMRADDLDLLLNDTVTHVTTEAGETPIAHCKSGTTWAFDLFVQTVGILPRYPEIAGLKIGRGIQIDEHSRTNHPNIYAAGDCTETHNPATSRWQPTRTWLDGARQGRVAGGGMAGRTVSMTTSPYFNASIIYDVFYAYLGAPHGAGEIYLWQEPGAYRKVRVVDGKLTGALLMGQRHGMMALYKAIGQPVAQYGDEIAAPEFPWNDLTGKDWGYDFY
ncbi:MAG: FAD-dependent oxidoreductase [Chloroflexi bacterium]|jgi:NAD(P)H-nitrite reductase large subunit|nr:FAD-dependent oxidoreductase [Chloroflexota bacterium]